MYRKMQLLLLFVFYPFCASAQTDALAGSADSQKTIHVLVALADNYNQKIVPVPKALGQGDNPDSNLYWGAMYGLRSWFRKSDQWIFVEEIKNPKPDILRRAVFKHNGSDTFMVADAYIGKKLYKTIEDFLSYAAGHDAEDFAANYNDKKYTLSINGGADLVAYIGHNGLMDFTLPKLPKKHQLTPKEVIVLACYSKSFFRIPLEEAGANAVLWTEGLMAPEGYVLEAALNAWIQDETAEQIRNAASEAYANYQKISQASARRIFAGEERVGAKKSLLFPEKNKDKKQ